MIGINKQAFSFRKVSFSKLDGDNIVLSGMSNIILRLQSSPSQSELSNQTLQEGEAEPDSECEGEGESFKSSETRDVGGTETKKTKTRATGRPSVVSKPLARTSFSIERRAKTRLSARPNPDKEGKKEEDDKKEEAPATDCGLRLLSEVQPQQHSSLKQAECNVESMKQYPSCKLENSIINESLNNGRNIMSTPKHIQNTCIKMNTSS